MSKRIRGKINGQDVDVTIEGGAQHSEVLKELKTIRLAIHEQSSLLIMLCKIANTGMGNAARR